MKQQQVERFKMTVPSVLINILNDAIQLGSINIHFTLTEKNDILIQMRTKNVMLPRFRIALDTYKQILEYINLNADLTPANKDFPLSGQSGNLIIYEEQKIFKCRISILQTSKFRSLILQLETLHSKAYRLKRIAEIEAFLIL